MKLRELKCCVCGTSAGKYKQHWNRDTGWGVCRKCVDWEISRNVSPDELLDLYGVAGVNYEAQQYVTFGRSFNVLASFPDTEAGASQANAYMLAHDYAALIASDNGALLLADKADNGRPIMTDH